MEFLVRLFRRETTSKEFIPVIDGLRFLAITMVVLFHADGFIAAKSAEMNFPIGIDWVTRFGNPLRYGGQGVELFFVISGFILAVPFMRYHLGLSDRKPGIKAYFVRRLTRLEPPYIISTILIFLVLVFLVGNKYPIGTLIPSLFYSLFYVHTLVIPGEFPYVNPDTWSLEVEVQYYIIAPFVVWLICRFKGKNARRTLTLLMILILAALAWVIDTHSDVRLMTIATNAHYFLAGILLCDIFLLDREALEKLRGPTVFIAGLILLPPILLIDHTQTHFLLLRIVSPMLILAFYLIVFGNAWWNKIFSLNGLTLIGGMCYSIYLIHHVLISAVGRITLSRLHFQNYYVFYWAQMLVLLLAVLAVSTVYFLLIEKPCMKRDWYIKLYEKIRGLPLFGPKTAGEENI